MKKRVISAILVLCLVLSIFPVGLVYGTTDSEGAIASSADTSAAPSSVEAKSTAEAAAYTEADSSSTATEPTEEPAPTEPTTEPDEGSKSVTRAEWIQMLVNTFSMVVEDNNLPDNYFSDLIGTEAYYRDILVAVEFGVIELPAGSAFAPQEAVTREFAARTLNYCLGFQLGENAEYTFEEATQTQNPEALQIAVNRGWLALEDGKLNPQQPLTADEMQVMQADAAAVLAAQDEVGFEENSATISEGVKEIPVGTAIGTDAAGNLTIKDCPITIKENDLFIAYYGELPVAMKALSVSTEDDVTTIAFTTDGTDGILTDVQFNGKLGVDLRDFVPDSETRTRTIAGYTAIEGPAKKQIKFDENTMTLVLSKDIKLMNGLKINVNYELKNVDLDYKVDQLSKTTKLVFYGDSDFTISAKGDTLEAFNDGESWTLGYIPILFGLARAEIVAEFGVNGEMSVNVGGKLGIGYTYNAKDGCRLIKEFTKTKFDCTAQVSAKIGVKVMIGFDYLVTRADLFASIGINGTVKDTRHLDGSAVKSCQDISVYLYGSGGVEGYVFLLTSFKLSSDLWDADTSPIRLHYHMEDGLLVSACTMGVTDNGYYTNPSSRYFNPSFNSGSSKYTTASGETVTLWEYTVSNGEATITRYNGTAATLTIPATIDGYPVVGLEGDYYYNTSIFYHKDAVRSIYLPKGLTSIGLATFKNCKNLSSVSIPSTVKSIGYNAFYGCSALTEITLPRGVSVSSHAFDDCTSLQAVYAPDSVNFKATSDYYSIFSGTNTTLFITKDTGCISSEYLYSYGNTKYGYGRQYGIKKIVVEEGITEIGTAAFKVNTTSSKYNTVTEIVLPSTVVKIGASAFEDSAAAKITMPAGDPEIAAEIGGSAFQGCGNLTAIKVPEGIVTLNSSTFSGCSSLRSVSLPSTLTTIGSSAFEYCKSLPAITFPRGLVKVLDNAFYGCASLESVSLPNGLTDIGASAFQSCSSLTSVVFPETLTYINTSCFADCRSLKVLYIPTTIVNIYNEAFSRCTSLETVSIADTTVFNFNSSSRDYRGAIWINSAFLDNNTTLNVRCASGKIPQDWLNGRMSGIAKVVVEDGITHVGGGAFLSTYSKKTLTEVSLPSSVIEIGASAFYSCASLETVNLPEKITAINDYTFYGCESLKHIEIHDRIMKLGSHVFDGAGLESVVIPSSVTEMGTYDFANCKSLSSVKLPAARKVIEPYTFCNCPSLTSIALPRLVNTVGTGAFQGCTALTEINWSEKIAAIGESAFRKCSALERIIFPESVTSIGTYALSDCTSLVEVRLPENTVKLPDFLLSGCTALESFTAPASLTAIGNSVFSGCSALKTVSLPVGLETVGEKVFYNCDALQTIAIPDGTKSIGNQCFYDCDALESLSLPNTVTSFGTYLCYSCDSLASLKLSSALTSIPEAAFMDCSVLNNVVIPRRVTTIGSNAFNVCPSLKVIMIPANVTTMAGNALSYPDRTVIYGRTGSYAQNYADEYGYDFVSYEVNATGVSLNVEEMLIPKGKTAVLYAAVEPEEYTDDVTWKTTNSSVAKVSDSGTVTAVSVGDAIIRIIVGDFEASCRVTVIEPVTRIKLNQSSLTLDAAETSILSAAISPSNATIQTLDWSSSDSSIASVDDTGKITALGKGTATITATAHDGSGVVATCSVTVTGDYVAAKSIDELQSTHPYRNDSKDVWSYTLDGAEQLYVSFNEMTSVEDGSDFISIYDSEATLVGTYTGKKLANQTVEVPGNTVVIKLESDSTFVEYGFAVSKVSTEDEKHVHSYVPTVIHPTCTKGGYTEYVCSTCGSAYKDDLLDPLGHDYVWTVTSKPTLSKAGTLRVVCSRCKTAATVSLPALNRTDYTYSVEKPATCTAAGIGRYTWKNTTYTAVSIDVPIAKTPHSYVDTVTPPSCTTQGYISHICAICGDNFVDQHKAALGHDFVEGTCSRCGAFDPDYAADPELTVFAEPVIAIPGSTITIPVMVSGGAGFAGFTLKISANEGLTLKNIETGALLNYTDGYITKNIEEGYVNWNSANDVTGDGEFLLLTFDVSTGIADGTELTASICLRDDKNSNFTSASGKPIRIEFKDIMITAERIIIGDVNGDRSVDTLDPIRLVRSLVNLVVLTAKQQKAADVDYDGDVTAADAVRLQRYLVGLESSLERKSVRSVTRAAGHASVSVGNAKASQGNTVTLPVMISNNPGFAGFTLTVSSTDKLTLQNIQRGALLDGAEGTLTPNAAQGHVNWTASENITGDGELLLLTFAVNSDAPDGSYTVRIGLKDDKPSNFASADETAVTVDFAPGKIAVHTHRYEQVVTPASCTTRGYTTHSCSCGDSYVDTYTDALDHNWGAPTYFWSTDNSIVTAQRICRRNESHVEAETVKVSSKITKEATSTAEGEITYTAVFRNAAFTKQVKTLTIPKLKVKNPFMDVSEGVYYYDPVLWAVQNNVTTGTSMTTFSPDDGCTRAQVVTFLWRAAGEPSPASSINPFSDVKSGTYYYNAVLWAVENGITNGTSNTTFSPDDTCIRAQIVTFLWRYEGKPIPASTNNPFIDVKTSAYFGNAVLWAVENGITYGTSTTTFSPDDTCTRAQVVTFLYRDIVN